MASLNRDVLSSDNANGLTRNWDPIALAQKVQAEAQITAAFTEQAYGVVESYAASRRQSLVEQRDTAKSPEEIAAINAEISELRQQEKMLNILIGAVTGSAGSALTKEGLASAADWMRQEMIKSSQLFPGIVDPANPLIIHDPDPNNPTVKDPTVLNNINGISVGVDGDGYKLAGTRNDLDKLCGSDNERCITHPDGSLKLDPQGSPQWAAEREGERLGAFLKTPAGLEMGGFTGGIQGIQGTVNQRPYEPGSWQDRLMEYFAGPHDMIGGQLVGLYDRDGNARRGRNVVVSTFHDGWSAVAIPVAAPFAMAKALPPDVWQAITHLVKAVP